MASTKIADIIQPTVFNQYIIERTKALSALFQSGIIITDPRIDDSAKGGGFHVTMPYFKDLAGVDDVLSDASPLVPTNITTGSQVAIKFLRGKAWGVNDLAKYLSGADPMAAIGDLVAEWWNKRMQAILIAQLTGIFIDNAVNDSADMTYNVTCGPATNALGIPTGPNVATADLATNVVAAMQFSGATFTQAAYMLGDAADQITGMCVHSAVMAGMVAKDLIVYAPNSEGKLVIPMFMGKRVIVDDTCPTYLSAGGAAIKYTSYIFTAGAVAYGDAGAPVPVETFRDALSGEDILINRKHFILHPQGYKWVGATNATPTNTTAALAASWDRAFERKNTGVVKFLTNG
jgi:hypothetical protein